MPICRRYNGQQTIVYPKCIIRRITGLMVSNSDDADCSGMSWFGRNRLSTLRRNRPEP